MKQPATTSLSSSDSKASDQMVKLNLTLLTVQPVLWEDEEGAAGWRQGLGGHTVVMGLVVVELCESWRKVTESFLDQRAGSWQEVSQSFSSASGVSVAHGSNIWVYERRETHNCCQS